MILGLLLSCASPEPPVEGELVFVRDGVLAPGASGQDVGGGRVLVERAWSPGESVSLAGLTATAPARAECVTLFSQDLGDVARLVAMGGAAPDTALAWSPDATRLAVGSYRGDVLVLDGWTGEVIARRHLAETMVKTVAWSPDGAVLYATEQSPDASLRALDPDHLEDRWVRHLSEEVETSPAPDGEDLYGVYTLPAAVGLDVLPGGDLLVVAAHGWNTADGQRLNRSRVLRLAPDGSTRQAWPEEVADAVFRAAHVDVEGGLAAMPIGRTASGPPPDLPIDGLVVLDLETLEPVVALEEEPLAPWFTRSFLFEAVGISRQAGRLLMGFGDGRVQLRDLDGAVVRQVDVGTPVLAGEVPIVASVGFGFVAEDGVAFSTSGTNIPWGAAAPELRPPMAHPRENTLWVHDLAGEPQWAWSGEQRIAGVSRGPAGHQWVLGAGERQTDTRQDLFGALIFDGADPGDGRGGPERLRAICSTEGPVFFRQALTADGRVAVAEYPHQRPDGALSGAYRVTVLR